MALRVVLWITAIGAVYWIEDVVGAFSAALGKVLGDLVAWTLSSGEADRKTA